MQHVSSYFNKYNQMEWTRRKRNALYGAPLQKLKAWRNTTNPKEIKELMEAQAEIKKRTNFRG